MLPLASVAQFAPIALTPGSFNQDVVVEKGATTPVVPGGYTTASMDGGTNNNGDTWNEVGFFVDNPDVGLPVAGSTFASVSDATHSFVMAPDYRANNSIMLDASATFASGTLTPTTPKAFGALSILTSGGNGGCIIRYTVHHQDGTTETGTTPSADWFGGNNPAWVANGRVNAQSFSLDNLNSNNPRLYAKDVTLTNSTSAIASIDLAYVSSAAGAHTCVMAASGAPTAGGTFAPIPVTGFNADIVVEATAPQAQPLVGATTATLDAGTANTGATLYELGYAAKAPATGLPAAGSILTNTSAADHRYVLPPSYTANNAAVLDAASPDATLTLATPTAFSALSLLGAAVNGNVTLNFGVTHQDGTTESGTVVIRDWFNNTPFAFTTMGRVNVDSSVLDNVNAQNPRLYSADFPLTDTTSKVVSISLSIADGGADARVALFALSGGSGFVAPLFNTQPATVKASPGENATLTADVGGSLPITFHWQHKVGGTFQDVTNGGNVSGATTATLSITAATEAQGGDYRLVATNAGGTSTSAVARVIVLSQLSSVTTPGDAITGFGGNSPGAENVTHAIDQLTSKYYRWERRRVRVERDLNHPLFSHPCRLGVRYNSPLWTARRGSGTGPPSHDGRHDIPASGLTRWIGTSLVRGLTTAATRLSRPSNSIAVLNRDPVPHRRLEHVDVYVGQGFETDAVPGDLSFAQLLPKRLGQVGLVLDAHEVDGDSGLVRGHADLEKLPAGTVGIPYQIRSVANRGVGDRLALVVLAVGEPKLAARQHT